VIKYLGSKRVLVPILGELYAASGAATALDLFTGTTRVAQEFCRRGGAVTAVDSSSYSQVLAQCYVELDARAVDATEVEAAITRLEALAPRRGYVTRTFCEQSRYFQPKNGMRIDAIRDGIDELYADSWMRPVLLTSLMEAADAVDSTVGLQMAYLKQWAPRAAKDLKLRVPELTPGTGTAIRGDATSLRTSILPTSTRRTTSIGTSRTITSGRRWSGGTHPSTTGSPASAWTARTRTRRACSTSSVRCLPRSRR